jgi:hypothetical protein
MGRKAKRLKVLKRIERLNTQVSQPSPVADNSVMKERVKREVPSEEKVDVSTDTNFTPEIVKEMIKEVEEMVVQVKEKPKPKSNPRPVRKRNSRTPRKIKKIE